MENDNNIAFKLHDELLTLIKDNQNRINKISSILINHIPKEEIENALTKK